MKYKIFDDLFFSFYPNGLSSKSWKNDEQKYIEIFNKNFNIFNEYFSKDKFIYYLNNNEEELLITKAIDLVSKAIGVSVYEKIAFKNFCSYKSLNKEFLVNLYNFLYNFNEKTFEDLTNTLQKTRYIINNSNSAKWTILTFFLLLSDQQNHILLKPTICKKLCNYFNVNIRYTSFPKYEVYISYLNLINDFKNKTSINIDNNITTHSILYVILSNIKLL